MTTMVIIIIYCVIKYCKNINIQLKTVANIHGVCEHQWQGRIQDFKLGGGAHLKKLRRAEGGAKHFGVFRVKNHDFTPKKSDFFPNAEGSAKIFGVFRVKNHDFTPKNHIIPILGGRAKFWGYFM